VKWPGEKFPGLMYFHSVFTAGGEFYSEAITVFLNLKE
jgi:hypothetical protein